MNAFFAKPKTSKMSFWQWYKFKHLFFNSVCFGSIYKSNVCSCSSSESSYQNTSLFIIFGYAPAQWSFEFARLPLMNIDLSSIIYSNGQINILFFSIFLFSVLVAILKIERDNSKQMLWASQYNIEHDLQQETNARLAAEEKATELEIELEQRVSERTAVLCLANDDLQESTSLMERIADCTPNLIYIYDLEKKCNVYSNSYIGEILGYSTLEIESMNIQLFEKALHPEDRSKIAQHHQECLKLNEGDYLVVEYRILDKSNNWHWLESKDTVFKRDNTGKPTQILGITQDITENKQIQQESTRLNLELAEKVASLENWHDKRLKLGKMNEFLQACLTIDEAKRALTDLLHPLFPNTHGAVYLVNNSKNLLEAIATWGLANSQSQLEPDDCWGLRRGDLHVAYPSTPGVYCSHVNDCGYKKPTLCLPMVAKNETLGMLFLRFDSTEPIADFKLELSETVAQNIAMSFANLRLQEKLRYQSLRDPLTGLYNRRFLQESLEKEIDRAHRQQEFVGIIMLDIDHFKKFNDLHGHSAGDLVLQEVGNYLLSQIRQYDLACRYGGEELVIVMPNASIEDTIMRAEQIRQDVKQIRLRYETQLLNTISVSIGVSCFPDDGTKTDELIQAADNALYRAKELGRDRVQRC